MADKYCAGCRNVVHTSSAWEDSNVALGTCIVSPHTLTHLHTPTGSECGLVEVYDVRRDSLPFASYTPHQRAVRRLSFATWK